MQAERTYFYELKSSGASECGNGVFNEHLNMRAAEGWELASVQYSGNNNAIWAYIIWQRLDQSSDGFCQVAA